jgi:hypothetical protein
MAAVGGGDESVCPARVTGPAEQESDEGRRLEGPRDEDHLPARGSVERRRAWRRGRQGRAGGGGRQRGRPATDGVICCG